MKIASHAAFWYYSKSNHEKQAFFSVFKEKQKIFLKKKGTGHLLILSDLATGASWLCCYKALQLVGRFFARSEAKYLPKTVNSWYTPFRYIGIHTV